MKQVGLLEQAEEGKSYKLIPIVINGGASHRIAPDENQFLSSLTAYLHVPKKEEEIDWESLLNEYKQLKSIKSKETWINEEVSGKREPKTSDALLRSEKKPSFSFSI